MLKEKNTINKSTTKSFKESMVSELKEKVVNIIKINQKNYYELGSSLILIKSLVGHSNFAKWLEEDIDFSHNLANKYMRIASNYSEEQAIELGVRKAYSLLSLKEDDRNKFLKDHDVRKMTCSELDEKLKEVKGHKVIDEKVKARNFIKNIDTFKQDLSKKISVFTQYKDEVDADSVNLIRENQDIFDKLEELNALINSKNINNHETPAHEYKDNVTIEPVESIEELEESTEEQELVIEEPKESTEYSNQSSFPDFILNF